MVQTLKKDNKGFTLVELLVVVAILGILAVVLVPRYIQYIEESRLETDLAQIEEISHAAEVATAANEAAYNDVKSGGITVTIRDEDSITSSSSALQTELQAIANQVNLKSKNYDKHTVTITLDANGRESSRTTTANP